MFFQVLNEKFSGAIQKSHPASFPDQYFTCSAQCLSCRYYHKIPCQSKICFKIFCMVYKISLGCYDLRHCIIIVVNFYCYCIVFFIVSRGQCTETVNHDKEEISHKFEGKCKYQDQYDNRVYLCKVVITSNLQVIALVFCKIGRHICVNYVCLPCLHYVFFFIFRASMSALCIYSHKDLPKVSIGKMDGTGNIYAQTLSTIFWLYL